MSVKKKIGILTWYNHGNFGSALQAYALQTYLKRLGFHAEVIAYEMQWCRTSKQRLKQIKSTIKKWLATPAGLFPNVPSRFRNPFQFFYNKYIDFSHSCTESTVAKIVRKYDVLITGSDQIWSPAYIDYTYLLNFCSSRDFRKISYAPSFGQKEISEDKVTEYKRLLSDYHSISIREEAGATILQQLGFSAEVVADPSLLLDTEDYRKIERPIKGLPNRFLFCYMLSSEGQYDRAICNYAQANNLPIFGFSERRQDYAWIKEVGRIGPLEIIWLIDHSDMTITNSFHGTILSMILDTPFFTYRRFSSSDPKCQNSRIEQLQKVFGIDDYVLDDGQPIPLGNKSYNYVTFRRIQNSFRTSSAQYLINAISK